MNKIADIDELIRIERMKLNLANSPEAKAQIQHQIEILKYKREIEQIRDKINKLS
jgi:hypothetical protein